MEGDLVSILLEDISRLLKLESYMPPGLADLIKSLDQDLMFISRRLYYLDREDDKLKDVLSSIQDVIQEAEDVIDTFAGETAKKKRSTLGKIRQAVVDGNIFQAVAKQVKRVRKQILDISTKARNLEFQYSEPTDKNSPTRQSWPWIEEDNIVGLDTEVLKVIAMLLYGSSPRLDVISIVGTGGIGKTTLAKMVYNHDLVKNHFERLAWVSVSSNYETKDLLLKILRCFKESVERMEETPLAMETPLAIEVKKLLQNKRYLIVLDDVWSPNRWKEISESFPDDTNKSRILITSRRANAAEHAITSPPYVLSGLSKDDSWELFKRIVFYQDDYFPPELEKIVDKCNGFPLALKVLGGELAQSKRTVQVWSEVANDEMWNRPDDSNTVLNTLTFSYNKLLPRLKYCFLYFGGFIKGTTFTARHLIRLWIAEGFVANYDHTNLEHVAEEYLEELLDCSMIQVTQRRSDGGLKSISMHDSMHDLSVVEGRKEDFFGEFDFDLSTIKFQRLSIQYGTSSYQLPLPPKYSSQARTLLSLADLSEMSIQMLKSICNGFPLLRVLDLGSTVVYNIPSEVENLIHLRYLRMNAPGVIEIPTSISNIPMLQTLDLRESRLQYLTNNFWDMQELRHLFLSGDRELLGIHQNEVKTMSNLQTLSAISSSVPYLLDWDAVFPNLRKLGLQSSKFSYTPRQMANPKFRSVQTLKIISPNNFGEDPFSSLGSSWRLTKLTLRYTNISLRVLEMVAKLPNLVILKLMNKSVAEVSIECRRGWFPKLQVLHMVDLDLRKWTFEQITTPEIEKLEQKIKTLKSKSPRLRIIQRKNGWVQPDSRFEINRLEREIELHLENNPKVDVEALQSLCNLSITKCRYLVEIPEALKKVTTLLNVKASFCNSILERKLRELGDNVHYEFEDNDENGSLSFMFHSLFPPHSSFN